MKRASQKLVDKWEARLKSEGMPNEFPTPRRQSLHDISEAAVNDYGTVTGLKYQVPDCNGLTSSASFQYWTEMTHAANALPRNYKGRAFLIAYTETGYFQHAIDAVGISWRQGRNILARFAETMKKQKEQNEHED